MKKSVAVFFGGISPEHEVSVITGLQVLANLNREKYTVIPVYVTKAGIWYTGDNLFTSQIYKDLASIPTYCQEVYFGTSNNEKFGLIIKLKSIFKNETFLPVDVIFPCFHGGLGESGAFQGLFEIYKMPFVGSRVLGSALGMDKISSKRIFDACGIPQAKFLSFEKLEWGSSKESVLKSIKSNFNNKVYIKPAGSGSSIGVSKASGDKEIPNALDIAFCFGQTVVVEESIEMAREINISVMGNGFSNPQVSVCEEVFKKNSFLSFSDKYNSSGDNGSKSAGMASASRQIPANLENSIKNSIEEYAIKAFKLLSCSGLVRVDFLVKEKEIYLIEVNTIPGSYSFYLWEKTGIPFSALCDKLIELSLQTFNNLSQFSTHFPGNLLSNLESSLKSPKLK